MSKRKSDDPPEPNNGSGYEKKKVQDVQGLYRPYSFRTEHDRTEKTEALLQNQDIAIGSCIQPINTELKGTVGPFVKIKETDELCFLTARHIFGPFQWPEHFKGTEIVQIISGDRTDEIFKRICGHAIAAEYSEYLDVVLVKVSDECIPKRIQFIDVAAEQMLQAGFHTMHLPSCGNCHNVMDARNLTSAYAGKYRLVKVGSASGLTVGIFHLNGRNATTGSYFFRSESPDNMLTEFLSYKNQLHVISVKDSEFANEKDVGAAVYLVDEFNSFHCIGMVCRTMEDGVLVTPIQDILDHLGYKLSQTLEIVTFDSQPEKINAGSLKPIYLRALRTGEENQKHVRLNIIGFYAQGKTLLTRRLFNKSLDDIESTDGIEVHVRKCKLKQNCWKTLDSKHVLNEFSRRLVMVANAVEMREKEECIKITDSHDETFNVASKPIAEQFSSQLFSDKDTLVQDTSTITSTGGKDIRSVNYNDALFRQFSEDYCQNRTTSKDELLATIWDFGGQFIYYATHHIFHSRSAIYLLVFDLNRDLNNVLEDYDFPERREKLENNLLFWVNSINSFVGTDDSTEPIIILVGTHKDKFEGNIDEKFDEVKSLFAGKEVRKHIYEKTFAVANFDMNDNSINELRNTIHQIGIKNATMKHIPAKWILLEKILLDEKHRNIVKFEEVIEISAQCESPTEDANQLKVFLRYHHDKGNLVFFDEEELNEYVVLNPQFLVDAFKCIIASKSICNRSTRLYQLWKKMTNMAILEKVLLEAVWGDKKEFSNFSTILLKFLKRHRIMAEILKTDNCENETSGTLQGTGNFLIPSFLKAHCSYETAELFIRGKSCSSLILGISIESNTIISTVFERILAASIGIWPPIIFREQYLVYQDVGFFLLNLRHAGKITKVEGKGLELMVIKLISSDEDFTVICDYFRRYVELVISQEFTKLGNDSRQVPFNYYVKCNHTDHNGTGSRMSYKLNDIKREIIVCCPDYENHTINVHKTVNEWFQKGNTLDCKEDSVRHVTEKDLLKLAQAMGSNWELLALELGVSADTIDRLKMKHKHSGIATTIFYMLKEWKDIYPDTACLPDLLEAIKKTEALSVNWDKIRNVINDF